MYLNNKIAFQGITKVFALTDPHQETRRECALLTDISNKAKLYDNVLVLNGGDLFKGIYPKELEVESYKQLKKSNPNLEIVLTLGNNDFGFNREGLDYLKQTVQDFDKNGIKTVCANIFENGTNKRPDWIKPYTIINQDNDRIFVTGFCINNINTAKYGISPKDSKEVLSELKSDIKKEKPDGIIVLNHDWFKNSEELVKFAKKEGIKIDLLIGGHEHDTLNPNKELNIYYPEAFSRSMYEMDLEIKNNISRLKNIQRIKNNNLPIAPEYDNRLSEYEKQSGLMDSIVPYTLHLPKKYSEPCPLGTFLADAMKEKADTDIAFFSTGMLMAPLEYKAGKDITNYDFQKTIIAETPIEKVELTADELKDVFQNALNDRMHKDKGNAKFLQCSKNIKIEGIGNEADKTYKVKEIYINNKPIEQDKKYTCAIDAYIGSGGQGNSILKSKEKQPAGVRINELLLNRLKEAPFKYEAETIYPKFELVDFIV